MNRLQTEDIHRYIWRWGMPAELWITNVEFVADFIRKHGVRAMPREHLVADDPVPLVILERAAEERLPVFPPRPFPGGIRVAHLHFNGDFYPLDQEQWEEFSRSMVERFQAKLEHVGTVSFDQLMELSKTMEAL